MKYEDLPEGAKRALHEVAVARDYERDYRDLLRAVEWTEDPDIVDPVYDELQEAVAWVAEAEELLKLWQPFLDQREDEDPWKPEKIL